MKRLIRISSNPQNPPDWAGRCFSRILYVCSYETDERVLQQLAWTLAEFSEDHRPDSEEICWLDVLLDEGCREELRPLALEYGDRRHLVELLEVSKKEGPDQLAELLTLELRAHGWRQLSDEILTAINGSEYDSQLLEQLFSHSLITRRKKGRQLLRQVSEDAERKPHYRAAAISALELHPSVSITELVDIAFSSGTTNTERQYAKRSIALLLRSDLSSVEKDSRDRLGSSIEAISHSDFIHAVGQSPDLLNHSCTYRAFYRGSNGHLPFEAVEAYMSILRDVNLDEDLRMSAFTVLLIWVGDEEFAEIARDLSTLLSSLPKTTVRKELRQRFGRRLLVSEWSDFLISFEG